MARMEYETLIEKLTSAKSGGYDLNEMVWACLEKQDWPLPDYAHYVWLDCCDDGDPSARMSTDADSVMAWLEGHWPKHRIGIRLENGFAQIDVQIPDFGMDTRGQFKGELSLTDMARGLAIACIQAHALAENRQNRLWAQNIDAVIDKVAPWSEWEVEKVGDYHHAVDHENRLLGRGIGEPEKEGEYPNRIDDRYALLLMREAYEKQFGTPEDEPDVSTSSGPGM